MWQVVEDVRHGRTDVLKLPDPRPQRGAVLVSTAASLISAGTERYVIKLAQASLLAKARQRPDDVRRVIEKLRVEGLQATVQQVRAKLDAPMPLGYSSAGVVVECGRDVSAFKPGDRVAAVAPHAGLAAVGQNLCAKVPDGVPLEQAAYASIGAVALQGIRLARVSLGESVLVVGLGLVGQIAVCLLKAQGCRVFGTDVDEARLGQALALGADQAELDTPRESVKTFSGGPGVDAVIITAATKSNAPIEFAADACRHKARIVLVGVTSLNLPRPPFFEKELEFTVSCSLGAGRGDPTYEGKGIDYPIGYARWTVRRNMQAVLDSIASGKFPAERLTTHRFPIEQAGKAYELIASGRERYTGIVLDYSQSAAAPSRRLDLHVRPAIGRLGVSLVGAGAFARLVMLPALSKMPQIAFRGVCSATGLSADHAGRRHRFTFITTDVEEILVDPDTSAVFVATRHDLHAELVIAALRAGKHVFVEKPLCIRLEELEAIEACIEELGEDSPVLMVGFNRRFAPATTRLRTHFEHVAPLSVSYRFATGELPANAWPHDEDLGGGRIVGDACHAIDTCCALVASPPVRVFAESVAQVGDTETTDDRVFITIRHANGSISNVSYQAGGYRGGPTERIEVFGGGRSATLEGWDRLELWSGKGRIRATGGKDKGHRAELAAFIDTIRKGGAWPIPWDQIHGTTWASLMAVESLRHGRPVDRKR